MDGLISIKQLTSLTAVVSAALFLTWVAKRALATVPFASKVPVWVYTGVIASGLTFIASRITGTLEGQTGMLMIDGFINGALASGIREWYNTATQPLERSGTAREVIADKEIDKRMRIPMWLLPLLLVGGLASSCSLGGNGWIGDGPPKTPDPISAEEQARVRELGTKALAGIEVAGIVVRDARQMVSDLAAAGVVPLSVRTSVNNAVIDANAIVQRVITEIATTTREMSLKVIIQQAVAAVREVATLLEAQTDPRIKQAGAFIRGAIGAVSVMTGGAR